MSVFYNFIKYIEKLIKGLLKKNIAFVYDNLFNGHEILVYKNKLNSLIHYKVDNYNYSKLSVKYYAMNAI